MSEESSFSPEFSTKRVARLYELVNRFTHDDYLSSLPEDEVLTDDITNEVIGLVALYGEHIQVSTERRVRCVQEILAILLDDHDRIARMGISNDNVKNRVQNTAEVISMRLNRMSREQS